MCVTKLQSSIQVVDLSTPVSNPAFPRLQTIVNLLHTIRLQPKLSKEASSSLVDIGEAIQSSVSPNELSALLRGTLMQEVYVRNSCLQALQVGGKLRNVCLILMLCVHPAV
jgi:hypothetical protein